MNYIPESDWKLFRELQNELVAKACDRVFLKAEQLAKSRLGNEHESYLKLYDLIQEENRLIAEMFDDPRRSNVIFKITSLKYNNILTDEQFSKFSSETKVRVEEFIKLKC